MSQGTSPGRRSGGRSVPDVLKGVMMDGRMNETEAPGITMTGFEDLLRESARIHGHLCPGQVLGVRMSILGLRATGIRDPKGKDRKSILVFVETDRCATDAIQSVTGCSLGKRSLKFADYGKMAATFLNLKTNRAVRVIAREDSRLKAKHYVPVTPDKYQAQKEAYRVMPDDELFEVMEVEITLRAEDMPGRPLRRVLCEGCGEYVQDARDIVRDGKTLCRPCAEGGYYTARENAPSLSSALPRGAGNKSARRFFPVMRYAKKS